jgi:hypothetical protein
MAPKRRTGNPDEYALHDDDVFVMPTAPRDDLPAQVILFLLQTELSADAGLFAWLEGYVRRTFKADGADRNEMARAIVLHAIKHKWYMEDARAWRQYIARIRRGIRRELLRQRRSTTDVDDLSIGQDEETRFAARLDGEDTPSGRYPTVRPWDPTGEFFTIDEVARLTERNRRTLYDQILRGVIAAQMNRGRRVIRADDVDRLRQSLPRASAIKILAKLRPSSGRNVIAATRKWVYRREQAGDSLEDILSGFLGRRVTVI